MFVYLANINWQMQTLSAVWSYSKKISPSVPAVTEWIRGQREGAGIPSPYKWQSHEKPHHAQCQRKRRTFESPVLCNVPGDGVRIQLQRLLPSGPCPLLFQNRWGACLIIFAMKPLYRLSFLVHRFYYLEITTIPLYCGVKWISQCNPYIIDSCSMKRSTTFSTCSASLTFSR